MTPRHRGAARAAFALYAAALLAATHWPGVRIEGGVPRPDLLVHAAAYAVLSAMLAATGWLGSARRPRAAFAVAAASMAFATLDELTQPLFARTADASDWAADAVGVAIGVAAAAAIARLAPRPEPAA